MELHLTGDDFLQQREKAFIDQKQVVYIISCLENTDSLKKRRIGRVLGRDHSGILYIGKASNVGRMVSLLLSIRDGNNGKNHSFGIRYKANPIFRVKFPIELLRIKLISTQNARLLESKKLSDYLTEFGELPPLNHNQ